MKIQSINAQEVLDSRGNPTVKTIVTLADGSTGYSIVPSGASTGKYEAVELRDNDKTRFNGLGVLQACEHVNGEIAQKLIGMDAAEQETIDQAMIDLDGTDNKARLGANAILSVSLAVARAEAISEKKPLYEYLTKFNPQFDGTYVMPIPEMNVMNGGKHAAWATDIQEYMLFPIGAPSIVEAVRMNAEVYAHIKKILNEKKYSVTVGDEGGYAPQQVTSNEEPFQILSDAITRAGYAVGTDICFGIDPAASEFYDNGQYHLNKEGKTVSGQELADFFADLGKKYPIVSMEDIFAEDDWDTFRHFTAAHGNQWQIVGDDLYVTNPKRLKRGIDEQTTNSVLIKLNQIGTLTETVQTVLLSRQHHMTAVVSHRSGETEDTFIADFVVAMGTGQIKTGAPCRSERTAKYNRLMEIERELQGKSTYFQFPFRHPHQ